MHITGRSQSALERSLRASTTAHPWNHSSLFCNTSHNDFRGFQTIAVYRVGVSPVLRRGDYLLFPPSHIYTLTILSPVKPDNRLSIPSFLLPLPLLLSLGKAGSMIALLRYGSLIYLFQWIARTVPRSISWGFASFGALSWSSATQLPFLALMTSFVSLFLNSRQTHDQYIQRTHPVKSFSHSTNQQAPNIHPVDLIKQQWFYFPCAVYISSLLNFRIDRNWRWTHPTTGTAEPYHNYPATAVLGLNWSRYRCTCETPLLDIATGVQTTRYWALQPQPDGYSVTSSHKGC